MSQKRVPHSMRLVPPEEQLGLMQIGRAVLRLVARATLHVPDLRGDVDEAIDRIFALRMTNELMKLLPRCGVPLLALRGPLRLENLLPRLST